jgi:general secretion pathway protein L
VLLLTQLIGLNAWAWKERNALEAKRQAAKPC